MTTNTPTRTRAETPLQKGIALLELAAFATLFLWVPVIELLYRTLDFGWFDEWLVTLFCFACLSLIVRRVPLKDIGLNRPQSWRRTFWVAATLGPGIYLLVVFGSMWLSGQGIETGAEQTRAWLIERLVISWTTAAVMEEVVFRGYLIDRWSDLFGKNRLGYSLSVVAAALLFMLGHVYQGPAGMLSTLVAGLVAGGIFLLFGRNLWLLILMHGMADTVGTVLEFYGVY